MTGELRARCATCDGSGRTTLTVAVAALSAASLPGDEVVTCSACGGSGSTLGQPSSLEALAAYDDETWSLREQILTLAAQRRWTRDVPLGSWDNRFWRTDERGEEYTLLRFTAVLTPAGEIAIQRRTLVELTGSDGRLRDHSDETSPYGLASVEDATRPFDFGLSAVRSSGSAIREDVAFPLTGHDYRFFVEPHGSVRVTRRYEKGHGLLTALTAVDHDALRAEDEQAASAKAAAQAQQQAQVAGAERRRVAQAAAVQADAARRPLELRAAAEAQYPPPAPPGRARLPLAAGFWWGVALVLPELLVIVFGLGALPEARRDELTSDASVGLVVFGVLGAVWIIQPFIIAPLIRIGRQSRLDAAYRQALTDREAHVAAWIAARQ